MLHTELKGVCVEHLALQVASGTGSSIAMGALLCVPPLTSGRFFCRDWLESSRGVAALGLGAF